MNIGIIVHSQTGSTFAVATRLQEALSADGHTVSLERVRASGPMRPRAKDVPLENRPAVDAYDALVFGAPVWGGMPASPMTSYLEGVPSLQGKQVACLMTHFFPAGWGGKQAMSRMEAICTSKGATVCASGSVSWLCLLSRKRRIAELIDDLVDCFKE